MTRSDADSTAPSKLRYNREDVLHHTMTGLYRLRSESRFSVWLSAVPPIERSCLSSLNIATSSQNLLTMLKKNKKGKDWWRLHWLRFLTSGFGRLRELCNFSLVSSMEKLQRENLATWEQWHPAAGKSKVASQVVPTSQRQREHRKKPSSESAPALLLTQKLFRRNLWFSIH